MLNFTPSRQNPSRQALLLTERLPRQAGDHRRRVTEQIRDIEVAGLAPHLNDTLAIMTVSHHHGQPS
jgi:hypothetical protein